MTGRIRVAALGAGYFSGYQYEAWRRMDDVDFAAICNRTEAKARALAETHGVAGVFTDLGHMLDAVRPDLLDIVTPPGTHLDAIAAAAARGVHVICQKPFTESAADAERAVAIADAAGIVLVVHENFRFQPWYREIRRRVVLGDIGEQLAVSFRLRPGDGQGPDAYLSRQPAFRTMERLLIRETAIHLVDTFRFLMGEVRAVQAFLRRCNPAIRGEDAGYVLFDFESGATGLFDGNRLIDHQAAEQRLTMGDFWIEGTEGVLRLDGDAGLFFRPRSGYETAIPYVWQRRSFSGDCCHRLQRHVVEHLTRGTTIENTGRDYLVNLRIEEAIYRAHETGRRVTLIPQETGKC